MRKSAHALIIQDRKVLSIKAGIYDIFPGGKIELGESEEQCLIREAKEELSGTLIVVGEYYETFTGTIPNKEEMLESKTYFCYVKKRGESESFFRFINSKDIPSLTLTEVSKKTLDSLIKGGLID